MKRIKVVIICSVMLIASLFSTFIIYGEEATQDESLFDIEIVLDASGSLSDTDSERNRFDAIDIFLKTLPDGENNVGAVVFNESIQLDTGLREMINTAEKNNLSQRIKKAETESGNTNIGLALDSAVKRLINKKNDKNKIILLISDGNTYLNSKKELEDSLSQKDKAIQQCIENDIKVYGICLNNSGDADINEFTSMAKKTKGDFLEVKTSDELIYALLDFYGKIFDTRSIEDINIIDKKGYLKKQIEVPSYGVEELNITIDNASKIDDLSITGADGIKWADSEIKDVTSKVGDYYFLKFVKPMGGSWVIELRGKKGTEIKFSYVYNSKYKVELSASEITDSLEIGDNIEFNAYFKVNGKKITGLDNYKDYKATLVLDYEDGSNSEPVYFKMSIEGDDGFKTRYNFEKISNYRIYAILSCGDFEAVSNEIHYSIGNSVPEFNEEGLRIFKIFKTSSAVDLNKYFSDKENEDLQYTLISSTYADDEIEIKGNELILNNLVDGSVTIKAEDALGANVAGIIEVKVTNLLIPILLIILTLIIVFLIILFKFRNLEKNRMFEGALIIRRYSLGANDSNSKFIRNFKGKIYLRDLNLNGTLFPEDAYFKVMKDKSKNLPKGNFSHKLRFVSPKPFYYSTASGELKLTKLDLDMNMEYVISLYSEQESDCIGNDSIIISLNERCS